jgi:hypothetical protein
MLPPHACEAPAGMLSFLPLILHGELSRSIGCNLLPLIQMCRPSIGQ